MEWHQYSKIQLVSELKTDTEEGLSRAEAEKRLAHFGSNSLPERKADGWWILFIRQFKSPLIYILMACSAIVYLMGEHADGLIILAVLLINAVIGVIQEGKAGRVFASLKKMSGSEAVVLRGGREEIVPEPEVVPGDVLVLSEGQKVPADGRLVFGYNISCDESMLTGETGAVPKKDCVLGDQNLPAAAKRNMLFKGTQIVSGNGRALVVGTGLDTELGKISRQLEHPQEDIPLQKNIGYLSRLIIYAVAGISAFLMLLGWLTGKDMRMMFSLVVSLAVSIIPEGLPLVLTVILAHGVWRMSKKNALVKKMQAVESLGQAKILAVDKTGTLTENQMIIKELYSGKKVYQITGNGYKPYGQAMLAGRPQLVNADVALSAIIASLSAKAGVLLDEQTQLYKVSGDPTEAAMAVFGEKLGFSREEESKQYKEIEEMPFDYKRKFRAVFFERSDKVFCAAAGAPEVLLKASVRYLENGQSRVMSDRDRNDMEAAVEEFSVRGFRVVAFGYKIIGKTEQRSDIQNLVFGGLYGIEDALRPMARRAVELAREEGVKTVMITGDHKITAKAIAREAGIFLEGDLIITGNELQDMSEQELEEKLPRISVFARVTPEDKMKIIKAYKKQGLVIAMTGDGVNDAPSLVAADLGVAMGKIGTEVAKEAADIVLLDDNLFSIITAIREGRVMYQNIKKALQFLFSTSLGELFSIVLALFLGLPLPVVAVQILWLNLVTDPLIGAALALEKSEDDALHHFKFKTSKYFIDWNMASHMLLIALIMGAGALVIFDIFKGEGTVKAQTMSLTILAVYQWYNGLNCRFLYKSILHRRVFSNRYVWASLAANLFFQLLAVHNVWMQKLLKTTALLPAEWLTVLVFGLAIIFAEEIRKVVFARFFVRGQ